MKKAYNILFSALALLAVGPISHAQSQAEKERLYYTDYGNGVGYSKTISSPDTNGVYTITLESFVTGNVTKKDFSAPVDIVLVLDDRGLLGLRHQFIPQAIDFCLYGECTCCHRQHECQ